MTRLDALRKLSALDFIKFMDNQSEDGQWCCGREACDPANCDQCREEWLNTPVAIDSGCSFCTLIQIMEQLCFDERQTVVPERIFGMNQPGGCPLNYCPECGRKLR